MKNTYRTVTKSLRVLAQLLEENDAFTIVELDGFLAAIASGPSLIVPSEWMEIAGIKNITFQSGEQANKILSTLMQFYNEIIQLFEQDLYKPLLTLDGLESFQNYDDWLQAAEDWADGYVAGITMDTDNWLSLGGDEIARLSFLILALTMDEEMLQKDLKLNHMDKTPDEIWLEGLELLPALSNAIYKFWLNRRPKATDQPRQVIRHDEKVGRNAPCPCGSGKKYKKCCMEAIH